MVNTKKQEGKHMNTRHDEINSIEIMFRQRNANDTIRNIEQRLTSAVSVEELATYVQWRVDQHDAAEAAVRQLEMLDDHDEIRRLGIQV